MFGDYFEQRGDYSTGVFYAGRRKYLNPKGYSVFEAPIEFKSKKEYRHMRASREKDSVSSEKFNLKFQPKPTEINKFRHAANVVKNVMNFESAVSGDKDVWVEESKVGLKYWVNKETGEVSSTCPWRDPVDTAVKKFLHHKAMKNHQKNLSDDEFGTGSLVYDSKEVADLFQLLDNDGAVQP